MTVSAKKTKTAKTSKGVTELNETGRRKAGDRRKADQPVATERREVQRRRQIDPTTCERDYTDEEIEFMQALDQYKRNSGRMFPTCSEILEVLRDMGYHRIRDGEQIVSATGEPIVTVAKSFDGDKLADQAEEELNALENES